MSFPGRGEVPNGNLKSCNFVIYLSCKIFTKTHVPLFVSWLISCEIGEKKTIFLCLVKFESPNNSADTAISVF